jgi:hypothetical protein
MTDGEIKDLFNTIDFNNNNYIEPNEWSEFFRIFINVYQEECDGDDNFLLSQDELEACFEVESEFPGFNHILEKNEELVDWVFAVLEPQARHLENESLNFADYIFLRKTHLAWNKCSIDERLSYRNMDCAIYVVVPGRRLDLPDTNEVFRAAMNFCYGGLLAPKQDSYWLNYETFLEIMRVYYFFSDYEIPFVNGILEKKDIIR